MKTWIDFAKTTAMGGFFGILPILLTFMVVTQAIDVLAGVATPIAAMLPVEEIGGVEIARVVALGLILAGCFLAGLLLRTRFGIWSSELVETAILNRLPGYPLLKTLSQRLGGMEDGSLVAPALADLHGSDARTLVFIVEEHDDGHFTVLVPNAPTPTIGTLYVLPASSITHLDATPVAVANCFMQWGIGSKALLAARG
jgi:uncharacterized membrane protein